MIKFKTNVVKIIFIIFLNNLSANIFCIDKSDFLNNYNNSILNIYWNNFIIIEKESKILALSENQYVEIKKVIRSKDNYWVENGTIYLNPNINDLGCLYHETFHSVFHKSFLHSGSDENWGEGFCDAFRYFMELKISENKSSWVKNIEKYMVITKDLEQLKYSKDKFLNQYIYPAVLIIYKSNYNYNTFQELWFELNNEKKLNNIDILNEYFNFNPKQ